MTLNDYPFSHMIKQLSGHCRPSLLTKRMRVKDPHEGDRPQTIATRCILGRPVTFYRDGSRQCPGMTDAEAYDSELLRFAHASLLARIGIGDKRMLYVDAMVEPVEVWAFGKPIKEFMSHTVRLMRTGKLSPEAIADEDDQAVLTVRRDIKGVSL